MGKTKLSIIGCCIFICSLCIAQQYENNWLSAANNYHKKADFVRALKNYNLYIDNNPDDPMGYIYRARMYETMGRKSESQIDLKIAQRLNPLSLMVVDPSLRSRYSAKKIYEFNFKKLDDAFVKSPSRYEDYEKVLDQLAVNHSQDSLITLIIERLNRFDVDRAEKLLNEVSARPHNEAIVYDLYGKVYMKRNDYETAIDYFNLAIEANPSFPIAYHNRSICYKLLGEYELAEQDLSTAISLNDDISLFYFTQAKLNERIGDYESALSSYKKALNKDENYREALINYSQLLKGLGDYEEGLKLLNQAIAESDDQMEIDFLEANINFIYGEYEEAISGYRSYLKFLPNDSSALFNLGLSRILIRQNQQGCKDLRRSIEISDEEEHRELYQLFCANGVSF